MKQGFGSCKGLHKCQLFFSQHLEFGEEKKEEEEKKGEGVWIFYLNHNKAFHEQQNSISFLKKLHPQKQEKVKYLTSIA